MARTGCETCKIRRIKCDEAKPRCQRCVKSNRICVEQSTVKPARFAIRVENVFASGTTKRPRGPPNSSTLDLIRPTLDLPSEAVTYYLNYYLNAATDQPTISAHVSQCLTAWMTIKRKSSMVDLAVSALALALYSRSQQNPSAAQEGFLRYVRLLHVAQARIVREGISSSDAQGLEESLVTILLMAWYETAMYRSGMVVEPGHCSMHSWSHGAGAMAILAVWYQKSKDSPPSNVIKQCRRGLLRSAVLRGISLPDWVWDGGRFGESGLEVEFDNCFVQAVNLRASFKVKQTNHMEILEIRDMITEARELDKKCQRWAMLLPNEWLFESHIIPDSWSRNDFYESKVYVCSRNFYAAVWIQYFTLRLLINSTLLQLLQREGPTQLPVSVPAHEVELEECTANITTIANRFAATIPYSLNRFNVEKGSGPDSRPVLTLRSNEAVPPSLALPSAWPLTVASYLFGIEETQQLWFRGQLARLGGVLGDGALESAGTGQWSYYCTAGISE